MKQQKSIDRLIRSENICPHCHHDKARSSTLGTFCMRCKKEINEEIIKPKPMRLKGVHHKANWKKKHDK